METYIHYIIRAAVCAYVLYRIWIILFVRRLFGLWERISVRPEKDTPEPVIMAQREVDHGDVIGKTKIVFLEDPELAAKIPARSEKLEPSGFIGEEPDIPDDEVESDFPTKPETPEEVLEEQQRFEVMDDPAPGLDPDFSTGLTFEEMANAVGVLTAPTGDEKQIIEAAKTIYNIRSTDLFEFFTKEVSNLDNVEQLMSDCLADDGTPLTVRKSKRVPEEMKSFDLNKYV